MLFLEGESSPSPSPVSSSEAVISSPFPISESGSDSAVSVSPVVQVESIDYSEQLETIISNQGELLKCETATLGGVGIFLGVFLVGYLFSKI